MLERPGFGRAGCCGFVLSALAPSVLDRDDRRVRGRPDRRDHADPARERPRSVDRTVGSLRRRAFEMFRRHPACGRSEHLALLRLCSFAAKYSSRGFRGSRARKIAELPRLRRPLLPGRSCLCGFAAARHLHAGGIVAYGLSHDRRSGKLVCGAACAVPVSVGGRSRSGCFATSPRAWQVAFGHIDRRLGGVGRLPIIWTSGHAAAEPGMEDG